MPSIGEITGFLSREQMKAAQEGEITIAERHVGVKRRAVRGDVIVIYYDKRDGFNDSGYPKRVLAVRDFNDKPLV